MDPYVTPDQLKAVMPFSAGRLATYATPLNAAMAEYGINTPHRQAAFLAQWRWSKSLQAGRIATQDSEL